MTKAKGGEKKEEGGRKRRERRRTDSREPYPGDRAHGHAGLAPSDSRDTSKARPRRRDSLGGHGSPRPGAQSSSSSRGPCLPQRELFPRAGQAQPSRHQASALSRGLHAHTPRTGGRSSSHGGVSSGSTLPARGSHVHFSTEMMWRLSRATRGQA